MLGEYHAGPRKLPLRRHQVRSRDGAGERRQCTCTFCSKRGGLWAYYETSHFRLLPTGAADAVYQREGTLGRHHFCPVYGCGTYTEAPDFSTGEPDFERPMISINIRLFDDFDLEAVPVTVIDGRNLW